MAGPGVASPVPLVVLGYGTNTPPGSPTNGDTYLLGAAPTGAWSGNANKLATYAFGRWWFDTVARGEGRTIFDNSGGKMYGHSATAPFELAKLSDVTLANLGGFTTAGDLVVRNGTVPARFAVGASDGMTLRVLNSAAQKVEWAYEPHVVTFSFIATTATAIGSETSGVINTSTTVAGPVVPAGKTFKVLGFLAQIETGTTNGTYDLDAIIRNTTDATDVVLGSASSVVSGGVANNVDINGVGTHATPVATVAAGKRIKFGWRNKGTSVAALSGTQKTIFVWGVFA